jgi:hypothetical protein
MTRKLIFLLCSAWALAVLYLLALPLMHEQGPHGSYQCVHMAAAVPAQTTKPPDPTSPNYYTSHFGNEALPEVPAHCDKTAWVQAPWWMP